MADYAARQTDHSTVDACKKPGIHDTLHLLACEVLTVNRLRNLGRKESQSQALGLVQLRSVVVTIR
jgi:hypothetical protein